MKINIYLKEGFWVVVGQCVSFVFTILGIKLLTNKLSPSEYGNLSLFLTYVTLITQIFYAPLCAGAIRYFVIAKNLGEQQKFYKTIIYFLVLFSFLSAVLYFFIAFYLYFSKNYYFLSLLTLAFVFSIFSGFIINIISILDAARKRMSVAFFQSLDTFFRHTFSILLVYCFLANSKYVFIGYIFASATLFYIFYLVYRSNIDLIGFSYDKVWVLNIWSYIRPFMIWGIFTWIQLSSDKWALAYFKSSNDVGLYSALYQIGFLPISIFVGFGVQLLTPIVFEKVGDGKNNESFIHIDKMITTVSIYIIPFIALLFSIAFFYHNQIFYYFFNNSDYRSVSVYLPWLILSGGLFSIGQAFTIQMLSKMKTNRLAKIKIFTSSVGFFLNFLFAFYLGVLGVVIANLLFSFLFLIIIIYYNRTR